MNFSLLGELLLVALLPPLSARYANLGEKRYTTRQCG